MDNLPSIRIGNKQRAIKNVERFVVYTFYRANEYNKANALSIIKELMPNVSASELAYFSEHKRLENPLQQAKLANLLLSTNRSVGEEGVLDLLQRSIQIPKIPEVVTSESIANAIRGVVFEDPEKYILARGPYW